MVRATIRKLSKLLAVIRVAEYRRALLLGVAASTEHQAIPFRHDFLTVLDVGANRGQFALFAAHRFPRAELLSFEPLPGAHRSLRRALRDHPALRVYDVALTARAGSSELGVARDDDSSSLLPPTATQVAAWPASEVVQRSVVRTARLDDELAGQVLRHPILLKIDVQGTELEVLRGADFRLGEIESVLVECSFVEMFVGQALADEVVGFLYGRGFRLASFCSPTWDRDGRCLQADLLFERRVDALAGKPGSGAV
jgi:FkbM family methyltransferase